MPDDIFCIECRYDSEFNDTWRKKSENSIYGS